MRGKEEEGYERGKGKQKRNGERSEEFSVQVLGS